MLLHFPRSGSGKGALVDGGGEFDSPGLRTVHEEGEDGAQTEHLDKLVAGRRCGGLSLGEERQGAGGRVVPVGAVRRRRRGDNRHGVVENLEGAVTSGVAFSVGKVRIESIEIGEVDVYFKMGGKAMTRYILSFVSKVVALSIHNGLSMGGWVTLKMGAFK